jgi:hypothetical protein
MNGDLPPAGRSGTALARSKALAAAAGLPVSSSMGCELSPQPPYKSVTRAAVSGQGAGKRFQIGPGSGTTGTPRRSRTRRTSGSA